MDVNMKGILILLVCFNFSICQVQTERGRRCQCGRIRGLSNYLRRDVFKANNTAVVDPPYKYPWMVSLYRNGKHYCGGAIISDYYVLTAAHCAVKEECFQYSAKWENCYEKPEDVKIFFVSSHPGFGRNVSVQSLIGHPDYRSHNLSYDIALLKTREKIPCSKFTLPICLPIGLEGIFPTAIAAGWIPKSDINTVSNEKNLWETSLTLSKMETCNKRFKNSKSTHFCAVGYEHGLCVGYSGGPLFVRHKGRMIIIGVTSFGTNPECENSSYEYFTDVKKFLPWIENVTELTV